MNKEKLDSLLAKARLEKPDAMISQVEEGLERRVLDRLKERDCWPELTLFFGGATAACAAWAVTVVIGFSEIFAAEAWNWMLFL